MATKNNIAIFYSNIAIAVLCVLGLLFFSSVVFAQEDIVPQPPSGVLASTILSSKSIRIEWSPSATEGVSFYKIYRSKNEKEIGEKLIIVSSCSNECFYIDSNVSYWQEYYYRVTAEKAAVESGYSNITSATPALPSPITVSSSDVDSGLGIKVEWQSPDQGLVLLYDVYRSTSQTSNGSRVATKLNATEYLDSNVEHNKTYYYRIRSVDEAGNRSNYSEQSFATAKAEGDFSMPTNVSASLISNNGVRVSWKIQKNLNVASFLVYRSSNSSDLGDFRMETSKKTFSEYALSSGAVYYYRVKTVLSDGTTSKISEPVEVKIKSSGTESTVILPVSNLRAEATGKSGQIKLSWDNPKNSSFVRIWRSTESSKGNALIADKVSGKNFTDKGLVDGSTYYYIVRAVSKSGTQSQGSEEVFASSFIKTKNQRPPEAVSKFFVQDKGDGKSLQLKWLNPSSLYSYIKIYRSEEEGKLGKVIASRIRTSQYNDSNGITEGQSYYYTIRTIASSGLESENKFSVRGIATTALKDETGFNDADDDGLPDSWERANGYNPHLRDLADIDDDEDGLGVLEEYDNGTHPWNSDSDVDGYSDGTEVLNNYNPIGAGRASKVDAISKKAHSGNFVYGKSRLSSIEEESELATELKSSLEYEFGAGKIPNPREHWFKLVNAYIYGGYTYQEIASTLRFGPGLVHPLIQAELWRNSEEYSKKQAILK